MDLNELGPLTQRFNPNKGLRCGLKRESYVHRQAAYMFAQGASRKEVAQALDRSECVVGNWYAQPWFQARVHQIQIELGMSEDVTKKLEAESLKSLTVLTTLRDDEKTPAAVKANIAQDILNRTLGKPVQRIQSEAIPHSDDPVAEATRLRQENERLARGGIN